MKQLVRCLLLCKWLTQRNSLNIVHETQRQLLELALLISPCVFGFLVFVQFWLIVNSCLTVWLGRAVSFLPRESKASRRPVTLDSPAIDKRQFKINEILFLKNKVKKKKLAPVISQLKNNPNCRTLMRRSFPQPSLEKQKFWVTLTVSQLPLTSDPTENRKQTKTSSFSKVSVLLQKVMYKLLL